jgi:hypothetical protein
MAAPHQVRGVLLEEAILMLLHASGYSTVAGASDDPTLSQGPAGLNVLGRGGKHQIDAITDLRIGQPFSNPQRLLVEAKAYSEDRKVTLPIVRGAVGVLKDVSEYWVAEGPGQPAASQLFELYAVNGVLTNRAALNLKEELFGPQAPGRRHRFSGRAAHLGTKPAHIDSPETRSGRQGSRRHSEMTPPE